MNCPFCKSPILWSEDRGEHCDGCDEYQNSLAAPYGSALWWIKGTVSDECGKKIPARKHRLFLYVQGWDWGQWRDFHPNYSLVSESFKQNASDQRPRP